MAPGCTRILRAVTVKAQLHARIDQMSDAEAERLLSIAATRLGPLSTPLSELPVDEVALTEDERASVERSYADVEAGAAAISIDELRGESR